MKSGPWGLAIILLLCVAVYFLWRSMNKHLRRAQQHFAADPQPASPAATDAERAARSEPRSDVRGGAPGPPSRTGTNTSPPPES
jgi:ABC-type nickel/cobalt efflux system permease component RcnA